MARNPRRQDEQLAALYAQLPALNCRGVCSDSCGPIEMSLRERARLERAAGSTVTCSATGCSMLTADRRCSQYDLRPLICRLWGVIESLRCPYGCVPDGGHLPDDVGWALIVEADVIGGAADRDVLRSRLAGIRALQALPEETRRRVARDLARAVVTRPSLDGRAGSVPKSIIEL